MQFDADCRPFTVAGFNAHHLVTNVLVLPHNHKTPGALRHRLMLEAQSSTTRTGLNPVTLRI